MSTHKRAPKENSLLWAGLAMIGAAIILALAGAFFVGRTGSYPEMAANTSNLSEARTAVEQALSSYGNPDLEVAEVMEFANNYYAEVREQSTGIGVMELLVDKRTGQVYPEPGPNMMWNTKYGMTSGGGGGMMGSNGPGMRGRSSQANPQANSDNEMPMGPEQATQIANDYLSRVSSETEAGEPETFYGYYTLHTLREGEVTGMLSVNGYTGAVWYHTWHGPFIAMEEDES